MDVLVTLAKVCRARMIEVIGPVLCRGSMVGKNIRRIRKDL